MITFEALVMGKRLSKDGTTLYAELADRESFARYNVNLPPCEIQEGEIVNIQLKDIRAFESRVILSGVLMPKVTQAQGK